MKEYKYTIIRRESRNPKRNREGRGVSQSDIEALKQELAGESRGIISAITDRDLALDNLTLTSTDLTERLATAEQALTGKLDSGEFSKWQAGDYSQRQSALDKALASKQPAGSYVVTSELASSAQQTLSEALKRAGEMDKQIKVGGRNLIVTSRWKAGYLYGDRDENAYPVGSENYKVLVGYDTFRFDPVYIPTLGESKVTYKLYDNGGSKNGTVQIHAYDKDKKFLRWTCDGWDGTIGHTNDWPLSADTAYIRIGVTNENVKAKVEFGTVATDWTPAPEDVAESVRTVNTSLVSLASTLESHKTATDKSFAELSEHPLTIDKDGYWQIWSVKDSKYLTTQYPSRGEAGQDAGRYLGRAKRIHPDFNGNYLLETEDSWRTAKEGDYVYLVGDLSNRGGDKDTYYIVREHKGNTVWEVYNIKGDKPVLSLDSQYRLVADGQLVSELSLKGRDGEAGAKGADGKDGHTPDLTLDSQYRLVADGKVVSQLSLKGADGQDGHTPNIRWSGTHLLIDDLQAVDLQGQRGEAGHTPELHVGEDDYLYIDNVRQRYIRGRQGEPGHSPKPDEVLSTDSFRQQLTSKVTNEVTTQVAPVNQRLESIDDKAEEARTIGSNAQRTANDMTDQVRLAMSGVTDLKTFETSATSQLSDLSNRSLTLDQKRDLGYLTFTLKSMTSGSGSNSTLTGLLLQRLIALSGDNQTISAYIASDAMGAVLKAGITGFGTANEREQVEITHQGTGHFGNLYFAGDTIDFRKDKHTDPYLSIGAEEATFIDSFVNNARVIDTPVSVSSVDLTASNAEYQRTISVANDGTHLTITLDKINVAVYGSSKLRLTLDGDTLAEWRGDAKYTDTSGRDEAGGSYKIDYTPYEASNLSYERVVKAGNHTVRLEIVAPRNGNATVNGLRVRRRYDTGAQQSALTKSGLRLFASPDRYFDVDYRKSVWYSAPNQMSTWQSNLYLVRIKGGAKVDKLTADELDAPGVPLCGASFNTDGTQIKAFGKYVNKRGSTRAQAEYDYGMAAFKVYHSIGHTNYIPIVQVSGFASNDINWSLTPRVYNITSEYFVVRILTNNDNPTARGISYVAYKTM